MHCVALLAGQMCTAPAPVQTMHGRNMLRTASHMSGPAHQADDCRLSNNRHIPPQHLGVPLPGALCTCVVVPASPCTGSCTPSPGPGACACHWVLTGASGCRGQEHHTGHAWPPVGQTNEASSNCASTLRTSMISECADLTPASGSIRLPDSPGPVHSNESSTCARDTTACRSTPSCQSPAMRPASWPPQVVSVLHPLLLSAAS
jgi:hypothetical protein